jgi:thioredoxin reductase (NADPH)
VRDTVVIGAGPAGLAVANTLRKAGVDCLVLEKGSLADHIRQYPTFMRFFSTKDLVEIDGFPLVISEEKPSRQEYLNYIARFVRDRGLEVRTHCPVLGARRRSDGIFEVVCRRPGRESEVVAARSVVAAVGAWEQPRTLGVPGEDLPKVHKHYREPHDYHGSRVLVVGGRNSAVETALTLYRAGIDVSLSYRRGDFNGFGLKYWLKPDIENRIANNEIHGHLGTTVVRIDWDSVTLREASGREYAIDNDFVILETGYDPPAGFLRSLGIEVEAGTNRPAHDPDTLETNVPGLFVAGTIIAGNVSGKVFIENSRHHGELILKGLAPRLAVPV